MNKVPMTVRGAKLLRDELKKLKSEDRPSVIKAIAEARAHGDLKENAEYHAAKDQQGFIEAPAFDIVATHGTAQAMAKAGVSCRRANKVREGRPHIVDMIKNNEISLIVNTTEGKQAIQESLSIRAAAVHQNITYYTTLGAAVATCIALEHLDDSEVNRLQDLHREAAA